MIFSCLFEIIISYWWYLQRQSFIHQNLGLEKLVHSPYKRIFCKLRSRGQEIYKAVQISGGKSVNVSPCLWGLKCQEWRFLVLRFGGTRSLMATSFRPIWVYFLSSCFKRIPQVVLESKAYSQFQRYNCLFKIKLPLCAPSEVQHEEVYFGVPDRTTILQDLMHQPLVCWLFPVDMPTSYVLRSQVSY